MGIILKLYPYFAHCVCKGFDSTVILTTGAVKNDFGDADAFGLFTKQFPKSRGTFYVWQIAFGIFCHCGKIGEGVTDKIVDALGMYVLLAETNGQTRAITVATDLLANAPTPFLQQLLFLFKFHGKWLRQSFCLPSAGRIHQ